ncbi:MAG: signal peptidase II [Spirochaetes bacterium]|nr:signal peptidase II [Spirochaetota bacterium]
MKKHLLRFLVIAAIISINIGCDQSTKYLAKKHLPREMTIQVIDNLFVLQYAENKGGFLSMFSSLSKTFRLFFLSIIPLIALVLMTLYIIAAADLSGLHILGLSCIIGGGLSNIVDRLANEYVIDFMNIGIGMVRSGIFNFADLSIMGGTAIILAMAMKDKNKTAGGIIPS